KTVNCLEELENIDSDEELDVEIDPKLINKLDRQGRKYEFVGDGYSDEDEDTSDGDYEPSESGSDILDDYDHLDNINEIKKIQKQQNDITTSLSLSTTTTTTASSTNSTTTTNTTANTTSTSSFTTTEVLNQETTQSLEQDGEREENNEEEDEENIELVARSFMYKYINEKKGSGIAPMEFTKEIGFKLVLEEEDDAWEIITAFLTRKKVAVNLFLNYLKYNSLVKPYRKKIADLQLDTFDKVIELFQNSKNIVIITGAGVSVSCGIPDFRSKGGVYETIEKKYSLPQPESLFDIHYLKSNPRAFFEFAKEIWPGSHRPSPTHHFIKKLEVEGKLLRNYTQNIDTLEHVAGIDQEHLVNCHGSFKSATCITCNYNVPADDIREYIMKMEIPYCKKCSDGSSFMKPDIVFFGESLPDRFDQCVVQDIKKVDLLVVMGSSLQVQPVALLPDILDKNVPQILVNREIVAQPHEFDYVYLGDCDSFVNELSAKLNWS
ncbi:hypothetical protein DICPUDRAFT_84948, partial [Dictyostelium purpureum]